MKAGDLWETKLCRTYFDVKILNPLKNICPKNMKKARHIN